MAELETTIEPKEDAIAVRYRFINDAPGPVLLFAAVDDEDTSTVYHVIEDWQPPFRPGGNAATLVIAQMMMPVVGTTVAYPHIPLAVWLERQAAHEQRLEVPLPVRYYNPHWEFGYRENVDTARCRRVKLRLGHVLVTDLPTAPQRVAGSSHVLYRTRLGEVLEKQVLVESEPVECDLEVLVGNNRY